MIIKQTEEMTLPERLAAENSNNQYLAALAYVSVGTIFPYAGATAPDTFKICDGSTLKVEEYPELFDVIGYTFGGSKEEFNLPDLRGRTLVGAEPSNTNFKSVGKIGGEVEHTLAGEEMPKHSHYIVSSADGAFLSLNQSGSGKESYAYASQRGNGYYSLWVTDNQGGGKAHNNMPPYLVCNYIIKVVSGISKDLGNQGFLNIDQTYDPESENAQSGKAVAQAVAKGIGIVETELATYFKLEE